MTIDNTVQTVSDAIFQCCNEVAKAIDHKAENNLDLRFDAKLGAGKGDKATAEFLKAVNELLENRKFKKPIVHAEEPIYEGSNSKFDFYIPSKKTVVEVALSLRNPTTEFEKDILKVLIFNQKNAIGRHIKKLIFIGKIGAVEKCKQGLRADMIAWVKETHSLDIEVKDITHSV